MTAEHDRQVAISDTPEKNSTEPDRFLDRRRQDLLRQVRTRSEKLGDLLLGVFYGLSSSSTNPQSMVHAAASARLLMDELGQYKSEDGSRIGDKITGPFNSWSEHMSSLPERVDSLVGANIDTDLFAVLQEIDQVVDWVKRNRKSGAEALRDELVRNGVIDESMPEHVTRDRQSLWSNLKRTFNKFVHGDGQSRAEIVEAVDSLVAMLEDAFAPTTFEDFKRIDELAQGGGS